MMTLAQAYVAGWNACFSGEDGRFTNPCDRYTNEAFAWSHGFLDAMDAEDGDKPEPGWAGYDVDA